VTATVTQRNLKLRSRRLKSYPQRPEDERHRLVLRQLPADGGQEPAPGSGEKLIDKTIRVWQPRYGRQLAREEGRQILVTAVAFFQALAAWDAQLQRNDQERAPQNPTATMRRLPERRKVPLTPPQVGRPGV
jgi:hypothetical protein